MALIEIIDPAFLKLKLDLIDISLSSFRDSIRGAGAKDFTTLEADVEAIYGRLDVALSTRASESTLATRLSESTFVGRWDGGIYGWDGTAARKIKTDAAGELQVDVLTIPNPPNLDVALSTRLSEATFTARVPVLSAWTRDIGGADRPALIAITSEAYSITRMPYMIDDISVTTTESSTSIAAPGAKVVKITNKGDVDCLVGVNGPVPASNPLKVRARTAKIFLFGGATLISYKTAAGSTTISIEYFN